MGGKRLTGAVLVGALSWGSLAGSDVEGNDLLFDYAGASPLDHVRLLLQRGYIGGHVIDIAYARHRGGTTATSSAGATAVPEPSTVTVYAGLALIGLARRRRPRWGSDKEA